MTDEERMIGTEGMTGERKVAGVGDAALGVPLTTSAALVLTT